MYSPKIDENQIKKLYQLKLLKKEPITKLVKEAIDNYLDGNLQNHNNLSTNKTILEQNAHFLVELFNKKMESIGIKLSSNIRQELIIELVSYWENI